MQMEMDPALGSTFTYGDAPLDIREGGAGVLLGSAGRGGPEPLGAHALVALPSRGQEWRHQPHGGGPGLGVPGRACVPPAPALVPVPEHPPPPRHRTWGQEAACSRQGGSQAAPVGSQGGVSREPPPHKEGADAVAQGCPWPPVVGGSPGCAVGADEPARTPGRSAPPTAPACPWWLRVGG